MHNTYSQVKLKTLILMSSLCDYSDTYILIKRNISVAPQAGDKVIMINK